MIRDIPISNLEEYVYTLHKSANLVILMLDEKGTILYLNSFIEKLTGYDRKELKGKNWVEIFIPSEFNKDTDDIFKDVIAQKNMHWGNVNEIVCKDKSLKTVSWNNSICFDKSGNFETILSVGTDITEYKQVEFELKNTITKLHEEHEKQKILFNQLSHITIEIDGHKLINANQRLFDFFDYENLEEYRDNVVCICDKFIQHKDYFHAGLVKETQFWIEAMQELPKESQMVIMIDKDNEIHVFSVNCAKIQENHYLVSFDDVTDLMLKNKEFEHKASHDNLTGIFNREKFTSVYSKIKTDGTNFLVMFDIDYFKRVNDNFGHDIGDKVLKELSSCVKHMLRDRDTFVRWGGEEFMIILPAINKKIALQIAQRIRKKVVSLHVGTLPKITISLGVTNIRSDDDKDEALKRVDEALYQAKAYGRNRVVLY